MLYSLTDKLKFEENPQIEVKGKILTVQADAETVLKLMDVVNSKGEVEGALEAISLLFSKADQKTINSLKLSMADYTTLVATAMQLAVGEDPDAVQSEEA